MIKTFYFFLISLVFTVNLFAAGGTIPAGLPSYFGFGAIDKADQYAASPPHFYKGTAVQTCWDYSYAYLTSDFSASGYNTWTGWVAGGQWPANELKYWEARGQIQVFTFYYTPYNLSNYTDATKMNQYYKDFKLLCQVIAANSTKKVIVHIEPDLLGFWRKAGRSATTTGVVRVGSANFGETCDGVAINSLPDTIQGFSEALYRIRNQYGGGRVLLAHHFSHWGNSSSKDVLVDNTLSQNEVNSYVDDTTSFITAVENGKKYDLIFVDPADRDADWFRIKGGEGNTRWTAPDYSGFTMHRSWGKLGYVFDRVSTNLDRKLMFWQIPVGNTYFKTCNNTDYHYRDNSAQAFIPSLSMNGSFGTPGDAYSNTVTSGGPGYWASKGFIAVLFGEGGYDQYQTAFNTVTHLRDWPNDGITNPTSDANPNGAVSFDVWGQATSTDADNDGGYIRKAVAAYCAKGKFPLTGGAATNTPTRTNTPVPPTNTNTNTPVPPTNTATSTNTPVPPTNTYTATRTNTPVPPTNTNTYTHTSTNTPVPPTNTYTATRTNTPVPPTNTNTYTHTSTNTPVPPTNTNTATRTNTPVPPVNTSTATGTSTSLPPTATNTIQASTATATWTLAINTPTSTQAQSTFTPTHTNTAFQPTATKTNTAIFTSTNTVTVLLTATYTSTTDPTSTSTLQPISTFTFTNTPVFTATFTATPTPTGTLSAIVSPVITAAVKAEIYDVVLSQNPYHGGSLVIYFKLTKNIKDISFRLYTASSRLIREMKEPGYLFAGNTIVNVPEKLFSELSNGTYYYVISANTEKGETVKSKSGVLLIIKNKK